MMNIKRSLITSLMIAGIGMLVVPAAHAAEPVAVSVKDGHFIPADINVPAGEKIRLNVQNNDQDTVEFESYSMDREVKIKPGTTAEIYVGPLKPGSYDIFDDKNPDNKGQVIAK